MVATLGYCDFSSLQKPTWKRGLCSHTLLCRLPLTWGSFFPPFCTKFPSHRNFSLESQNAVRRGGFKHQPLEKSGDCKSGCFVVGRLIPKCVVKSNTCSYDILLKTIHVERAFVQLYSINFWLRCLSLRLRVVLLLAPPRSHNGAVRPFARKRYMGVVILHNTIVPWTVNECVFSLTVCLPLCHKLMIVYHYQSEHRWNRCIHTFKVFLLHWSSKKHFVAHFLLTFL